MAKKILIFLFMLILCSFTVLSSDFYFQKNRLIDLKITCFQNGANCESTVLCNLTTMYPNGSIFIENKAMTYHPTFFSYEITDSNVTGEYANSMVCISNSSNTYTLFSYEVNNKGNNEQPTLVNALLIIVPVIFGILLIIAGMSMGEEHQVLKFGLLLLSLLTFIMSVGIAMINIAYYSIFDSLVDTLGIWIYVYGCFYFLVLCYVILYAIVKMLNMVAQNKDRKLNY